MTAKYQPKDTVLDDIGQVKFRGTPKETREWLLQLPKEYVDLYVRPGYQGHKMAVQEYLDA